MAEDDGTGPAVRVGGESLRAVELRFHGLTRSFPLERDDPMRDFLVTAQGAWVRVEVMVRTWGGDGLHDFLAELADGFRAWAGARTWRSLERDLTLSAEHTGSRVRLTWGCTTDCPTTSGISRRRPITPLERTCATLPWNCARSWRPSLRRESHELMAGQAT